MMKHSPEVPAIPIPSETRYKKVGRRYRPVAASIDDSDLKIPVGAALLITCTEPGSRTYMKNVDPDRAAFLAAATLFRHAMVQAINEAAKYTPSSTARPYSKAQQDCIRRFREEMNSIGSLLPEYWTSSSAQRIAEAAIKAVEDNLYETQPEF